MIELDNKKVDSLCTEFGSPLYVFRESNFLNNYREFVSTFSSIYPKYVPAYSYKTNYTPYICKLVKDEGAYAEVVSDMEYFLAKRLGYDNCKIVYNGPFKGPLAEEHLLNGGILNIDNLEELQRICGMAKQNPGFEIKIGLRLNLNIGQKFVSRFGIDTDSIDFTNAVNTIKTIANLKLCGIHCHIGQSRSAEAWINRTKQMLSIADSLFEVAPEYIDLGSGMYARMEPSLASQFGDVIPDYKSYAAATAALVEEHYSAVQLENKPILITEPGTTLINSYVDFITKVSCIKRIKGKTFVVLDSSKHNLGEICSLKKLPVSVITNKNCKERIRCINASFVGYTCLEHDVLYPDFNGLLGVGDYVVFSNVGGYSNVSKPPFILPNCAMVSLGRDGSEKLIKVKETFSDIFNTYIFPEK